MSLKSDECEISVTVSKTIQEHQYEPFHISLTSKEICKKSKREEEFDLLFENLEEQLYTLINKKLESKDE